MTYEMPQFRKNAYKVWMKTRAGQADFEVCAPNQKTAVQMVRDMCSARQILASFGGARKALASEQFTPGHYRIPFGAYK